jgi:hypothetical protein
LASRHTLIAASISSGRMLRTFIAQIVRLGTEPFA